MVWKGEGWKGGKFKRKRSERNRKDGKVRVVGEGKGGREESLRGIEVKGIGKMGRHGSGKQKGREEERKA